MKVGVIGLGSIGLRHAKNLRDLGHEVIGYDPDERKMWEFQGHTSERIMCFGGDAVVIASPSEHHIHDLLSAVVFGVPLLIEKPIALEVTEKLRALIAELNADEGLPAMVGYNLRFHGSAIQAKTWMDRADIGNPLWAHFCCGQKNDRYGHLIQNWSHEIDLALWLLGPAKLVACLATDRVADLLLLHENGCQTSIHLDYVTHRESRYFNIVGTKGGITVDLVCRAGILNTSTEPHTVVKGADTFDENYITEMKAFLRRAEGHPAYGAKIEDGLAVLEICDAARTMAGLK